MRIGCVSDIHGQWESYDNYINADIDVLIIAGDICQSGELKNQEVELRNHFKEFISKFNSLTRVVIVPGNHDKWIEENYLEKDLIKEILGESVEILVSRGIVIDNIHFYGNPYTDVPDFYAFSRERVINWEDINLIPEDVDILITHAVPRNYNIPCVDEARDWYYPEKPGCLKLYERVKTIQPRYHIFGHIHSPCTYIEGKTTFMNVSQKIKKENRPNIYIFDIRSENYL